MSLATQFVKQHLPPPWSAERQVVEQLLAQTCLDLDRVLGITAEGQGL